MSIDKFYFIAFSHFFQDLINLTERNVLYLTWGFQTIATHISSRVFLREEWLVAGSVYLLNLVEDCPDTTLICPLLLPRLYASSLLPFFSLSIFFSLSTHTLPSSSLPSFLSSLALFQIDLEIFLEFFFKCPKLVVFHCLFLAYLGYRTFHHCRDSLMGNITNTHPQAATI